MTQVVIFSFLLVVVALLSLPLADRAQVTVVLLVGAQAVVVKLRSSLLLLMLTTGME